MTTKARQLAELIANSLVDSDEISTGAVTTSKLADTLDFSSKTMVMADNQLSGDKIHGGTVSAFASTGIDDNASATAVTIASDGKVGIGTSSPSGFLHTEGTSNGTEAYAKFSTGPLAGDQILTVKSNSNRNNIALQANTGAGATSALSLNPDGSNVGIGTSSPDANSGLTVESSTTSGQIMVKGNNGGNAGVAFKASGQTTNFSIYENSGANLVFQKHASERMRIDSSGHLMVGTTAQEPSVSNDDSGFSVRPVGTASISRTSGPSLDLNRKTSDGDIAIFRKDGTSVGSIGATVGDIYIDGPAGHSGIRLQASSLLPRYNGSDTNGTMDLGYYVSGVATHRWRNLYLSNSIANPSGNLKLAASGDITLESNSGYIWFNDDDITIGYLKNESTDLSIYVHNQSRDMLFKGNDDGSTITALTLDMSDAGKATFNNGLIANGDITNTISGTYNLNGANGTAGNPAYATYSFKDDPNTGMYRAAADTLAFTTGGSESMRILRDDGTGDGAVKIKGGLGLNFSSSSDASQVMLAVGTDNSYRSGVIFELTTSQSLWACGFIKIKCAAGRNGLESRIAAEYLYRFQAFNESISGIALVNSFGNTSSFTITVGEQNANSANGTVELKVKSAAATNHGNSVTYVEVGHFGGISRVRRGI